MDVSLGLGPLPAGWTTITGAELTELISKGASPRWQGFAYGSDGMLFVTSENVRDGHLDVSSPKFLPLAFHEKLRRTKLRRDDILINLVGASIGRSCRVKDDLGPANINQAVAVFRLRDSRSAPYVEYFFQSPATIERILEMQADAARPNISLGNLRSFIVALPPLPEQNAIAAALSDVDALLGALDGLIAKKRTVKQAAMRQLLTGQARLPGFSSKWETKRLGDHVTFLRNGTHARAELDETGPLRYLHYGDIHTASSCSLDAERTSMPRLAETKARTLDRLASGDVVFVDASEDLAGVGKAVELRVPQGTQVVAGLHTIAARFDKLVLADGFKAYLQFIPTFRKHLTRMAAGTKVYATSHRHIADVTLDLPSTAEQGAIATVLIDMDIELSALEQRRDKTRLLKQGMMQELLTGRTRLV
jgi:type I restriction enzyme S subunit